MRFLTFLLSVLWLSSLLSTAHASEGAKPTLRVYDMAAAAPFRQTPAAAQEKSVGCVSCHTDSDQKTMHFNKAVVLGCVDCHGGKASVFKPEGAGRAEVRYQQAMDESHVLPRFPGSWKTSANPKHTFTLLNKEAPEFIRFMNPSDYRVADYACGACHQPIIEASRRSLMATGAMLWGGAAYNNGILPFKRYITGEAYQVVSPCKVPEVDPHKKAGHGDSSHAASCPAPVKEASRPFPELLAQLPSAHEELISPPAVIRNPVPVTPDMARKGILPELWPLPSWETTPPADVFRVFERGGRNINTIFPETGLPNSLGLIQRLEEPGRPDFKQSNRGPGTGQRIAVPVLNVHKTRLNDPFMWFIGTNDQPGDYRHSGCAGCHVVYANDREKRHSGPYAEYGNEGRTVTNDPTISKTEEGHPLQHQFTRSIPTSQCMVCHMHQPNIFLNSMLGYTMWDYESDAPFMWPKKQKYPSDSEIREINQRNPEEAAIRGLWGDLDFLKKVWEHNDERSDTTFADYHGHGWNFRAIYSRDKKGNLLSPTGEKVSDDDPKKLHKAQQLYSIHVEKGMHCVDCHFGQDMHGNGHLVGEVAQAVEIDCQDCHGTANRYPSLRTSGPAAPKGGHDLQNARVSDGRLRFEWIDGALWQRSSVTPGVEWEVHLVKDSLNPKHKFYNEKAARAKLMTRDTVNFTWKGSSEAERAHQDDEIMCITCHSSWTTSCFGCHLPIQANWKSERQHFEGGETRNYATYNPQVARDDFYMIGKHGEVKGKRIAPIRSTSALILSSTNANREKIYIQQPPVSASGYSSQAFAPHYAHTERTRETKTCSDCHVSASNDNNAWMASVVGQGTGFVNFVGYNAWVGQQGGLSAVTVTEWDEPQAVIGSYLQRYAYPDYYQRHQSLGQQLQEAHHHSASDGVNCLQLRGEYLYAAEGKAGMQVYDVASIANKGVSQRIISAPFSPWGQNTRIPSKNATCVVLPTNQPITPAKNTGELMRVTNQEQPFHPIYHYALVVDAVEGLILTNVDTLQDGEPRNNHLKRALTWNAAGVLNGAKHLALAGHIAYIATPKGVVVLDLDDPLKPKLLHTLPLTDVRAVAVQFRYLFATTSAGLQVMDITDPRTPQIKATVPLADAHKVYLARTFAYVAGGKDGLVIVDIQKPEAPFVYSTETFGGKLKDVRDVIVGSTNASLFAYVADAQTGLNVVQLTAPDTQPKFYGFSPDPKPYWIAGYQTPKPALALSRGLDRDRAVDESGHQIAIFGRIGALPFNAEEVAKLFKRKDGTVWWVRD
jgi:hypothetical protein